MADGFNNKPRVGGGGIGGILGGIANNVAGNFAGVFSTKPMAKYASGARCILKINDQIVGFAFGVSWRINTSVLEVNTIDNPLPAELIPQRTTVEGTISALHIPGTSATTEGWQADVLSFLFHNYITIEVRDSVTDAVLFATRKAMITSRQEEIRVDQLANVTLTFRAIGWRDEKEPAYPTDIEEISGGGGEGKIDNPNRTPPDTVIRRYEAQQNVKKAIKTPQTNEAAGKQLEKLNSIQGTPIVRTFNA